MTVRVLADAPLREIADRLARGAGIAMSSASAEAFDAAILPHAEIAALLAARKASPGLCSDLGRLESSREAGRDTVHTVAISPGAPEEASAFARLMFEKRQAAGFSGAAVRRAAKADTIAARELVFAILGEYGFTPEPNATDADLMDLEAGFLAEGGMFDVAVLPDGTLVGCCGMKILGDGRLELRKMYVRRDMRGQGLGQRLLDRALSWARARSHPRVELETASVLKEAIALYRKAGFAQRPGRPDTCRCDQAFVLELT